MWKEYLLLCFLPFEGITVCFKSWGAGKLMELDDWFHPSTEKGPLHKFQEPLNARMPLFSSNTFPLIHICFSGSSLLWRPQKWKFKAESLEKCGQFCSDSCVFCPRPIMQSVQARCLKKLFASYFLRITLKDWEYRGAVQVIGQFPILAGSAPGGWGAEAGDFLCLSLGHWTLPSIALSTHELFLFGRTHPQCFLCHKASFLIFASSFPLLNFSDSSFKSFHRYPAWFRRAPKTTCGPSWFIRVGFSKMVSLQR